MAKKYVPISCCRIGDIIACDVITSYGAVLIVKNTTINNLWRKVNFIY